METLLEFTLSGTHPLPGSVKFKVFMGVSELKKLPEQITEYVPEHVLDFFKSK